MFSNIVSSQSFVLFNGRVLSEKKPVISANITLSNRDSIYGFTFTDKNGKFSLKIPTNIPLPTLIISHLSIEKIIFSIVDDSLFNKEVDIYAVPRVNKLPEVQVESTRKGVSITGDTTSFAASKYSDGSETVLEDLLKKIPGIKVSEDGKISFRGKQISKVLFEGNDLYKDKYRVVTKNLTNKIIDSVQAIENFNSNSLLKGITSENETVLNLVVKNEIKNRISGNTNINLGSTYEASLNVFLIKKSCQFVGLYTGNNIGITETGLFEEDNNKTIISNTNSFSLPITNIQIPETFLGFKKSIPNNSHLGNLSFGKNKKDKSSITANLSIENNKQWRSILTNESLITNSDSLFFNSFREYSDRINKIFGGFEIKNAFSKKTTLVNHFDLAYSEENLYNNLFLPLSFIIEQSKLPSLNLLYDLEFTTKVNDNSVLLLSGTTQYSNRTQFYHNTEGLHYPPIGSPSPSSLINDILQKKNTLASNISARLYLNRKLLKFMLGLSSTYSKTSRLDISTKVSDSILFLTRIPQSNESYENNIYGQLNFTLKKISFSLNGGLSMIKNSILGGQNNILLNAKMGIKWIPSKNNFLLLFISKQPTLNDLNNYSTAPLIKDYRTIQYSLSNWKNFSNTNLGIVYGYNNFFKAVDLSASFIIQKKSLSIVRFFTFSGFNTRSFLDFGPSTNFYTSNISAGKYISNLNVYIKADFLKSFNNYFNAIGTSSLEKFNFNTNSFGTEIRSSFDCIFNFTAKAKFGNQKIQARSFKNTSTIKNTEIGLKTRFRFSNHLQFIFDATNYSISSESKNTRILYSILNTEIKYSKPRTKWHLVCKMINIGNLRKVKSLSFSDILISTDEIYFLGRRVTIGGSYLF